MHGFPRFAGTYGGGGNRTRVGCAPETAALQELRWICEDAYHSEQQYLSDLARRIDARRDFLATGPHTYLYLVFDEMAAKIGIAADPVKRARHLQISNHRPLILYAAAPATRELERFIHEEFDRIRGEWFHATPPLLAFADMVLSCADQCWMMEDNDCGPCDVDDTLSILGRDLFADDWMVAA